MQNIDMLKEAVGIEAPGIKLTGRNEAIGGLQQMIISHISAICT
jgi:hypothetical protein